MKSPKIRFKGFDGDWEQRKLGDVVDSVDTGKSKFNKEDSSGEYPILGSTSVIGYDDKYDYEGDFILTARVGANAGNLYRHAGKVKISDNTVFIQTSQNIEFLYQLLIQFDVKKLSFGTGQPLVKASELKNLELMIPTDMKEQMRIGMYLKNLDNLITLHQKKCEQLTILKKYMLQKMFPQNGSDKPEIRFEGFTDDWEQRKLGEILIGLQNNTLSRADLLNETGVAKNVHYGDVLIKFGEVLDVSKEKLPMISDESILSKYKSSFLQNGDIIVADTAEDSTVGKCSEIAGLNDEIVLSGLHTIPYRPIEKFASGYLGYYLNSSAYHNQLIPLMQGIKVTSISKSAMQDTDIVYPKSVEEQGKIGDYFQSLDNLITLHQQKCDELRNAKKFMLQNMFI